MKKLTKVQESMIEAAKIPFVPKDERAGLPSRRETMCRGCLRWTKMNPDDRRWYHVDDETIACVDPDTYRPYTNRGEN